VKSFQVIAQPQFDAADHYDVPVHVELSKESDEAVYSAILLTSSATGDSDYRGMKPSATRLDG